MPIDEEAHEKIKRLENKLKGAHLTPGIWQIVKQALQATFSWTGWEVFGIGTFIFSGLFLFLLMVFGFLHDCEARETEQYQPTCKTLGMTFSDVTSGGRIICSGTNRIVSINPKDLSDTEVFNLNTGKVTRNSAAKIIEAGNSDGNSDGDE